jgi:hypothetical protein
MERYGVIYTQRYRDPVGFSETNREIFRFSCCQCSKHSDVPLESDRISPTNHIGYILWCVFSLQPKNIKIQMIKRLYELKLL